MADNAFFASNVRVEGARELRRELKRAGGNLDDLKEANRHAAETILPIAAGLAPIRTGRLKASLRVGATRRAGILRAGKKLVPYAGPIHWGWPLRGIRPHPYLSEAAQGNEDLWIEAYMAEVRQAISKVNGKKL